MFHLKIWLKEAIVWDKQHISFSPYLQTNEPYSTFPIQTGLCTIYWTIVQVACIGLGIEEYKKNISWQNNLPRISYCAFKIWIVEKDTRKKRCVLSFIPPGFFSIYNGSKSSLNISILKIVFFLWQAKEIA